MSFTDDILAERERIEKQLQKLDRTLSRLPEGDLSCRSDRNSWKWFRIVETRSHSGNDRGRRRRQYIYIPKSKAELARGLALRRYCTAQQKDLLTRLEALNEMEQCLRQNCHHAEGVLAQKGMTELIQPQLENKDERIEAWLAADYPHNTYREESLRIPTIGGFNVRSKSEALIANMLLEKKLPFRYECGITFGARTYYPDFTILHPDSYQTILWEHFGMMSSPDYQNECAGKLSVYESNGFFPFVNLITTQETDETPFDAAFAARIIRMMFDR